jgi:hypothetical protein
MSNFNPNFDREKFAFLELANRGDGLSPINYMYAKDISCESILSPIINGGTAELYTIYSSGVYVEDIVQSKDVQTDTLEARIGTITTVNSTTTNTDMLNSLTGNITTINSSNITNSEDIITNVLKWSNSDNEYYIAFKAGELTKSTIWSLPLEDGTAGQILSTNGEAILSFIDITTAGAAPKDAQYVLNQPNENLANAQALSQLLGGILKSAPLTGVISIATPDVDYATVATLEELAAEAAASAEEASAAALEATAAATEATAAAGEASAAAVEASLSATGAGISALAAAASALAAGGSASSASSSASDASDSADNASSSATEAQNYLNTLLSTGLNALPCTGDVSFQGFKLINLGTPIVATDGATKGYVDTAIGNVPLASLTLQGAIIGSGPLNLPVITTLNTTLNEITNAGNINIANFLLNNVLDPLDPQDGATKNYVDTSSIVPSRIIGYPSNSSLFLNGAGSWTAPSFSNLITTNSLSYELTINNTNASSTDTGLLVKNNGINAVNFGFNNSSNEAYVWAYGNALLKFGTNATTRMQLLNNGTLDLLTNSLTTTGNINAGTINVLNSLVMGNNSITGLANPVIPTDGANKQYVDDAISSSSNLISLSGAISGSGQTGTVVNTILSSLIGLTTNQVFNFTGSPTSFNYDLTIPNSTNQTVKLRLNRANTGNGAGYEFQFYSPTNGVDTFTFGYNSGSVFGNIYTIANNVPVINYTYSLNVSDSGSYQPYNGSYGYLSSNGSTGQATGQNSYSINCTNRVKASEFDAVSSKKIKTILGRGKEIEHTAIELFKKIPLFKYKYKDTIKEGDADHYGVIAEELAEVIPAFVNMQDEGWIPNIYKNCIAEKGLDNSYKLYFNEKLENIEGHKLKLIFRDKEGEKNAEVMITEITADSLSVICCEKLPRDIFAYGTYSICPTVSKQKVFELGLVVLQMLVKRVEILENK